MIAMKRCISVVLLWIGYVQLLMAQSADPILFTIKSLGDEYLEEVTKSEFEYIYKKNNTGFSVDKKSLDEYLQLFIDFKLKVLDAKTMWIDRSPAYKNELATYEAQLTIPYLRDSLMLEMLAREAYDRAAYDVYASHILVSMEGKDKADTAQAFAKINDIYAQLKKGASFQELAAKYSDCPSKRNGGDLGVIGPFTTVYPFENVVYSTEVGKFSAPFRTKFGYHIVMVTGKKPHVTDVRYSQIVMDDSIANKDGFAEKLCEQLNAGKVKFPDMVKKYSIDTASANKKGDAGYLSAQPYIPPYFSEQLRQIGEKGKYVILRSFVTTNIVVITDMIGNKPYEEVKSEYLTKVERSDRGEQLMGNVVERLKKKYGLKVFESGVEPFYRLVDLENIEELQASYRRLTEPMYEFNGNVYSQETFLPSFKEYRISYRKSDTLTPRQYLDRKIETYFKDLCWETAKTELRNQNADFRNLMKEYSDGLLLFEASSRKVWNKAAKDKDGLTKFFEENKAKYNWPSSRYKGVVIRCEDKQTLDKVNKLLPKLHQDSVMKVLNREFNKDGKNLVKMERGIFAEGSNSVVDRIVFKKQSIPADPNSFVTVKGKLISGPETYMDVKGPVTADYQNYLESNWVETLRERHEVHIFDNVLQMIREKDK